MKIRDIEFPAYFDTIDKNNDNIDVFVTMEDGMTYTMVVTTPSNYYWYMDKEGLDYIPASPPDVIVRTLTKENIWKAIETFTEDNAYWLKLFFLSGDKDGVFDQNIMDEMIKQIKKVNDEIENM
ncbi:MULTISPECIES: hypothetical protein [unclassified Psychrobacillus]|uniref:hypothetical protein n=1 Tax=unclassified Psychrobacillus TaxID=2636677 RepID=UPI00146E9776|nr:MULTISPECIES: hypothetical protein [unclassified Psychrobacillus]MCM3360230.1 hypothetical protein [Psychrobacillus sp. MER TA 171]NME07215.1 hypothetical protein [Psychrobacillus sp. BL-248-WT-3]